MFSGKVDFQVEFGTYVHNKLCWWISQKWYIFHQVSTVMQDKFLQWE